MFSNFQPQLAQPQSMLSQVGNVAQGQLGQGLAQGQLGQGLGQGQLGQGLGQGQLGQGQLGQGLGQGQLGQRLGRNAPEPWASMTSLVTASQKVNKAISAESFFEIERNLGLALESLQNAIDLMSKGADAYPLRIGYKLALIQAKSAKVELVLLMKNVPKRRFSRYQQNELLDFQATLGQLYSTISSLQ